MRQKFFLFTIFLITFLFVFRSLLANLDLALVDWRDYALMVWITFQNMNNVLTLNFQNYFETNSFYPHHYSLLFSDLLLPQSILSLPFYLITKNLILSFNIVFIITFILNYVSSFLFWKQVFKKDLLAFFGSLLIIFSPFFHLENSHFQMMSYWPFFFSLYFLLKAFESRKYIYLILAGLFIAIQFTASVYLSVYLLTMTILYFIFRIIDIKSVRQLITSALLVFITFFFFSGIFIKGYFDMKKEYNIKRDLSEYITYSAHLSDYLFTSSINSVFHKSSIMKKWNSFDKNGWGGHSSSPGFLILTLFLVGLFAFFKVKKQISLSILLDRQKGFFLAVMLLGFIFSLGPRLNFNGQYAYIPMPYTLALKFFPLVEATRVPARWSFLFFLGLIFFALLGLNKLTQNKYKNYIFGMCFLIFVLEYIPLDLKASIQNYTDERTTILKELCVINKEVVLEIPVTHLSADTNIADGLSYITKTQLASTEHGCFIINGYSGYDLKENFELSDRIDKAIETNNVEQFINELRQENITIVKFNSDHFNPTKQAGLDTFLKLLEEARGLRKIDTTIFAVNKK